MFCVRVRDTSFNNLQKKIDQKSIYRRLCRQAGTYMFEKSLKVRKKKKIGP